MEEEPGADMVERILRTEVVILPFVVFLEVYYVSRKKRGQELAEQRYAVMKALKANRVETATEAVVLKAGEFKASYRLSLADALIGAFAFVNRATLVHKDPEYEPLLMIEQLKLPYKQAAER